MENFIRSWSITNLSICDQIIEYHKKSPLKSAGLTYDNFYNQHIVNKEVKDSVDVKVSVHDEISLIYSAELKKIVNNYINEFSFCNWGTPWGLLEDINIQYYPPGGGFKEWHCERSSSFYPSTARHLVFMTYLNDIENGGETEFFYQKIKVKPSKGLTLIWPADWTYTHRGIPAPQTEKYIITGWLSFLDQTPL
jgi:hypothetical protein